MSDYDLLISIGKRGSGGPEEERSRLNGTILWSLKDDMSAQVLGNASHGFILNELYFTLSIHNPPVTIYTEY